MTEPQESRLQQLIELTIANHQEMLTQVTAIKVAAIAFFANWTDQQTVGTMGYHINNINSKLTGIASDIASTKTDTTSIKTSSSSINTSLGNLYNMYRGATAPQAGSVNSLIIGMRDGVLTNQLTRLATLQSQLDAILA